MLLVSESIFGAYERAERIPPIEFLKDADKGLDARGALIACIEITEKEKYPPTFLDWVRLAAARAGDQRDGDHADPRVAQTPAYTQ